MYIHICIALCMYSHWHIYIHIYNVTVISSGERCPSDTAFCCSCRRRSSSCTNCSFKTSRNLPRTKS